MKQNNTAVFILTNRRPDNVKTLATLKKQGYTGRWLLVLDDKDTTYEHYARNYGAENLVVFNKDQYIESTDAANNFGSESLVVFARNACHDIAEKLQLEKFLVLDDDYSAFDYRIDDTTNGSCGIVKPIKNLDHAFDLFFEFLEVSGAASIALAQGGDFIGGINNGKGAYRFNKRKCMNTFFCKTSRRFAFIGALNEDVNTYVLLGSQGVLFLTIPFASITQIATQSNRGGLTDAYLASGTYVKSFYSVMCVPSAVKIMLMNAKNKRLHHVISWQNVTPCIISENFRKALNNA